MPAERFGGVDDGPVPTTLNGGGGNRPSRRVWTSELPQLAGVYWTRTRSSILGGAFDKAETAKDGHSFNLVRPYFQPHCSQAAIQEYLPHQSTR